VPASFATSWLWCGRCSLSGVRDGLKDLGPIDAADYQHGADQAVRALAQRRSCQSLVAVAIVGGWLGGCCRRHAEQFPAQSQLPRPVPVAEEAEVADAAKPIWQHVDQEAANKLIAAQAHDLLPATVAIVLPAEADAVPVDGHQPAVEPLRGLL